ncbi:hypothetical protein [Nocardia asteroides]|uniref:hypothetical protein n=1 Tax=Nocardia asteroides TaxID=1824 RepID=UPI001E29A162|nr:hypothetical protein [Nocardia asteroides]UGT61761.1 hypothetical protein LTT61_32445 [Nocardia asteroides]
MRSEAESAVYAALPVEYRQLVDVVDRFPHGVQARRIARMTYPGMWELDEADIDSRIVGTLRDRLSQLAADGFVAIERSSEYGDIYRPVNSPLDMATWTLEQGRAYYASRHAELIGADQLPAAAYAMVLGAWRTPLLEDAHAGDGLNRISDGEMFAANVAAFRIMCCFLTAADRRPEAWQRLSHTLTDPERVAAGSRTVADLLGEHYPEWAADCASAVRYYATLTAPPEHDMAWFIAVKSCFGAVSGNWFGMPGWARVVDAFAGRTEPAVPEAVRAALLTAPDQLDPAILEQYVRAGIGTL